MPAQHILFPLAAQYVEPPADLTSADSLVLMHFETGYPGGPYRNYGVGAAGTGIEASTGAGGKFGNGLTAGTARVDYEASITNAFTMDAWMRYGSDLATSIGTAAVGSGPYYDVQVIAGSANLTRFDDLGDGYDTTWQISGIMPPGLVHIEATRSNGTWRLFINGISAGSHADSDPIDVSGFYAYGGDSIVDEWRVMVGLAAHNANFTPPTEPYSGPQTGISDSGHGPALALESTGVLLLEDGSVLLLE